MYIEDGRNNKIGMIAKQQAEEIAAIIETDKEKARRFLQEMGEDDDDEAINFLIDELKSQ